MADHFIASGKKIFQLSSIKAPNKNNHPNILFRDHFTKLKLSSSRAAGRNEEETGSECFRSLWPFFWFARFLGICPVWREGNHLVVIRRNPYWIFTIVGFCIQGLMLSRTIKVLLTQLRNAEEWVETINEIIYYGHTFGNTLFVLWKIKQIPRFLSDCKQVEQICKKYEKGDIDDGLVRRCTIVLAFFLTAQFTGDAMYYYSTAARYNVTSTGEFFQAFNNEFIGHWGSFYSGIFFGLGEFYCDMGWTFGDILLGLLSIILARYFDRLNKEVAARGNNSLASMEELRADHRTITNLVKHANNLFSPLFLLTYVANVGYLFSRLYTGLEDDLKNEAISVRIESIYAFIFQVMVKILLPSYLAAQLHERAHETLLIIHSWSSSIESPDLNYRLLLIARFVSQLVTDNVGISGCGYFLITKGFVVTLISALITYEVIILQFQAASLASASPK